MTTPEERIKVLEMIQSGQINADEGARLLESLKEKDRPHKKHKPRRWGKGSRQFRILVTDLETGQEKINMRMPWNLISVGVDMGARFARKEIKITEFAEAVQAGAEGKIMDMIDEEDGERVQVFVE